MEKIGISITCCDFETVRLKVTCFNSSRALQNIDSRFLKQTLSILSDEVTSSLPTGWQGIRTESQVTAWLADRMSEGLVSPIFNHSNNNLIGFLLLSEEPLAQKQKTELRLGYFLDKKVWGLGLGTELIEGFVSWCKNNDTISLVTGGVDTKNIGSSRVLEKNGFVRSESNSLPEGVAIYERTFDTSA